MSAEANESSRRALMGPLWCPEPLFPSASVDAYPASWPAHAAHWPARVAADDDRSAATDDGSVADRSVWAGTEIAANESSRRALMGPLWSHDPLPSASVETSAVSRPGGGTEIVANELWASRRTWRGPPCWSAMVARRRGRDLLVAAGWRGRKAVRNARQLIVRDGADVNEIDPATGHTPLLCALTANNSAMARMLLELGARWPPPSVDIPADGKTTVAGKSLVHKDAVGLSAAIVGRLNRLPRAVRCGPSPINHRPDTDGEATSRLPDKDGASTLPDTDGVSRLSDTDGVSRLSDTDGASRLSDTDGGATSRLPDTDGGATSRLPEVQAATHRRLCLEYPGGDAVANALRVSHDLGNSMSGRPWHGPLPQECFKKSAERGRVFIARIERAQARLLNGWLEPLALPDVLHAIVGGYLAPFMPWFGRNVAAHLAATEGDVSHRPVRTMRQFAC
jgi:hypothetical protein